jgi:rhomboid protease GluP
MSSLLDPPASTSLGEAPDACEAKQPEVTVAAEASAVVPLIAVEAQLLAVTRRTPVTWLLLAANLVMFGLMAMSQHRLFHFNPNTLLTWGGGLAPRVFGSEWWRAGSHMFVHGDLAHLAVNMLFLLLIGSFVERLIGPVRFALIYLFAGVGGGLLAMGTNPQRVVVGASTAIFGIYGALLGCCLRGPRSCPWRFVGQRAGVLLIFTVVSLLADWLDFEQQPALHLSGFAFGLAGGFLCGHKLQPRAARWRLVRRDRDRLHGTHQPDGVVGP